jgi:hypothetical protein
MPLYSDFHCAEAGLTSILQTGSISMGSLQQKCSESIPDYGYAINIKRVAKAIISYHLRKGKVLCAGIFVIPLPFRRTCQPGLLPRIAFHKESTNALLFAETPGRCFPDSPNEKPDVRGNYCLRMQAGASLFL